jgi:hypothetical protein
LNYESFSSCEQSYNRNIGYFENLTLHLQTETDVKCVSEMVHKFLIINRCISKSAGMMMTNEIEHYMQQWNYIKISKAKAKN